MVSKSTKNRLYCSMYEDVFDWDSDRTCLPPRCSRCINNTCRMCMEHRVKQNLDTLQLKFDFREAI